MTDDQHDFVVAAARYCELVESKTLDTTTVLRALVRLVDAALGLAEVEPTSSEGADDPPGLDQDAQAVSRNVMAVFGSADRYWEVFDPRVEEPPIAGSLCDDLTDIYRDLRLGLYLSRGERDDALWEWRFSFETHWGKHATDAIRVLHSIAFD